MIRLIDAGWDEDPGFIEQLNAIIRGLLRDTKPQQLFVIQIDNWFDHKWLRFSGKGVVRSPMQGLILPDRFESALDSFSQDKITLPPFTPDRIISQWCFEQVGKTYQEMPSKPPHKQERRTSSANLHHRVADISVSACFVWFSANTVANDRGSVMVYVVTQSAVETWFAAFRRNPGWKLDRTKGISMDEVKALIAVEPAH